MNVTAATAAAIGCGPIASSTRPATVKPEPNSPAFQTAIRPLGSGRFAVRFIRASRECSTTWFQTLPPAATSPVPSRAITR